MLFLLPLIIILLQQPNEIKSFIPSRTTPHHFGRLDKNNNNNRQQRDDKPNNPTRMYLSNKDIEPKITTTTPIIETIDLTCTTTNEKEILSKWRGKEKGPPIPFTFNYQANQIQFVHNTGTNNFQQQAPKKKKIRGIVLIHPIGVGIGKWYYNRLLDELSQQQQQQFDDNNEEEYYKTIIIAPDLLACGTASNPQNIPLNAAKNRLPLFTVPDWSHQILQLLEQIYEKEVNNDNIEIDWCLLSNGGCVPIAISAAAAANKKNETNHRIVSVILSAPPQARRLLSSSSLPLLQQVQKTYRRVSGWLGQVFWSYSLFRNGRFIKTFSERNLASDPKNLGPQWTPMCVDTAKTFPLSRYSTFAFLSGALQYDCRNDIKTILSSTSSPPAIHVIRGKDKRRNPAKSWFWTKAQKRQPKKQQEDDETLARYVKRQGGKGYEIFVGGRRCPAHEDAKGFAAALMQCLNYKSNDK